MPQIMIDTDASSPQHLRMTARFLEDMAATLEGAAAATTATSSAAIPAAPIEVPPAPKFGAPLPAGASPTPIVVPPAPPPPVVPSGTVEVPPPPGPSAPAPSVQTAATPAVPPATSGADPVELDSEGFPYDARIHGAGENRKKKTGEWKYRRGIDNALIQTVEAELRAKGYGVKPTASAPPPPAAPPPPPLALVPPAAPPPPPSVLVPPAPAAGVSPPPPPVSSGVPSGADAFRSLMKKIAPHMAPNGKLALAVLTPIYTKLGVKGLEDFAKPGAPVDQMNAEVDAILGVA